MTTNKDKLLEATVQLVVEDGFDHFSMKRVTEMAGTSEALIYKHYGSKENLFRICFEQLEDELRAYLKNLDYPTECQSLEDIRLTGKRFWTSYVTFMLQKKYHTLYYYTCWQSPSFQRLPERTEMLEFTWVRNILSSLKTMGLLKQEVNHTELQIYLMGATARLIWFILTDRLEYSEELLDSVWDYLWGGLERKLFTKS